MRTDIYKKTAYGEDHIGYLAGDGTINRLRWGEGLPVGRVDGERRIFRTTQHGERELGQVNPDGSIRSHGLFEGGELGWVETDGAVFQGGYVLPEEEVGRVTGPHPEPAAAALLLLFLPDQAEENKRNRTQI